MIYTDYPTNGLMDNSGSPVKFKLAGDGRINCRMQIAKTSKTKLPSFEVKINNKAVTGKAVAGGNLEFEAPGNAVIQIKW